MTDRVLHEALVLWPAWTVIVGEVSRSDPREADPQSVYGSACAAEIDRLVALLYGRGVGDSLDDAARVLGEVMGMAAGGRRPKFGHEMGLRF